MLAKQTLTPVVRKRSVENLIVRLSSSPNLQTSQAKHAHDLQLLPLRFLQPAQERHRQDQDDDVGQSIDGGDDGRSDGGVHAVMPDADLPVRIDGRALEDRKEGLHEAVANDEDASDPQRDDKAAVHEEDAAVQVQERAFCRPDCESPYHFRGYEQLDTGHGRQVTADSEVLCGVGTFAKAGGSFMRMACRPAP